MKFLIFILLVTLTTALNVKKSSGLDENHKKNDRRQDRNSDHDHLNVGSRERSTAQRNRAASEDKDYWFLDGQAELEAQLEKPFINTSAKNIILFIGDGTSVGTFTAARLAKGFRTQNFEREVTSWETFPYSALIKTYNTDMMVTDSGASSTAYLTGSKGNQETIGVDSRVTLGSCPDMLIEDYHTQSVLRDFQLAGRSTGIVTTTRVTHASPAGSYAHTADRGWEDDSDQNWVGVDSEICDDIAEQLIMGDTGKNIDVILGGGRRGFRSKDFTDDPEGCSLSRDDGKDLVDTWVTNHNVNGSGVYLWNRTDLIDLDVNNTDSLLGLFDCSHMSYAVDSDASNPTLEEMTIKAIEILQKNDNGFFLFVEGGMIDQAHHNNEHRSAIEEALEFEKAVAVAAQMTSIDDTLIVVTADHAQPMHINGYTAREGDVLGLSDEVADDQQYYSIMMYTTGPGFRNQDANGTRPDAADEDWSDPHYAAASTIPRDYSTHSGEDVALFARGPQSHLFTGIHENSYIPAVFRYASCLGQGKHFCDP